MKMKTIFQIWLDYEKQVQRWIANNKSNYFLLPVGALSYFEDCLKKFTPNSAWLAKREKIATKDELQIRLQNAQEFIAESRAALKRRRFYLIGIAASVFIVLSYLTFNSMKQKNEALAQKNIAEEKTQLVIAAQKTIEEKIKEAEREKQRALDFSKQALTEKQFAELQQKIAQDKSAEALRNFALATLNENLAKSAALKASWEASKANLAEGEAIRAKLKAEESETAIQKNVKIKEAEKLALESNALKGNGFIKLTTAINSYNKNLINGGVDNSKVFYNALYDAILSKNADFNLIEKNYIEQVSIYYDSISNTLVGATNDGTITSWNLNTKTKISTTKIPQTNFLDYIKIISNNEIITIEDNLFNIWSYSNDKLTNKYKQKFEGKFKNTLYIKKQKLFCIETNDTSIAVFDLKSTKLIEALKSSVIVLPFVFPKYVYDGVVLKINNSIIENNTSEIAKKINIGIPENYIKHVIVGRNLKELFVKNNQSYLFLKNSFTTSTQSSNDLYAKRYNGDCIVSVNDEQEIHSNTRQYKENFGFVRDVAILNENQFIVSFANGNIRLYETRVEEMYKTLLKMFTEDDIKMLEKMKDTTTLKLLNK